MDLSAPFSNRETVDQSLNSRQKDQGAALQNSTASTSVNTVTTLPGNRLTAGKITELRQPSPTQQSSALEVIAKHGCNSSLSESNIMELAKSHDDQNAELLNFNKQRDERYIQHSENLAQLDNDDHDNQLKTAEELVNIDAEKTLKIARIQEKLRLAEIAQQEFDTTETENTKRAITASHERINAMNTNAEYQAHLTTERTKMHADSIRKEIVFHDANMRKQILEEALCRYNEMVERIEVGLETLKNNGYRYTVEARPPEVKLNPDNSYSLDPGIYKVTPEKTVAQILAENIDIGRVLQEIIKLTAFL